MTTKTCPGFGGRAPHTLPLTDFGKNAARADGYTAYCKACSAACQAAWRRAHPETVKANKKRYREREAAI